MRNNCRLVIFDWEGTLADTLGQVLHIVTEEAEALGMGAVQWEQAKNYVELGLCKAIQKLFSESTALQQEQLMAAVQKAMISGMGEVQLIPGARECLEYLQQAGILLAVASNKGHSSLQRAIISAGLESFFAITLTAGQTAPKPSPEMLYEILDFCQVEPKEAFMIGDSLSDMEMANAAGVKAIGVDFYHQQDLSLEAAGAKVVFDNYGQLTEYLKA